MKIQLLQYWMRNVSRVKFKHHRHAWVWAWVFCSMGRRVEGVFGAESVKTPTLFSFHTSFSPSSYPLAVSLNTPKPCWLKTTNKQNQLHRTWNIKHENLLFRPPTFLRFRLICNNSSSQRRSSRWSPNSFHCRNRVDHTWKHRHFRWSCFPPELFH